MSSGSVTLPTTTGSGGTPGGSNTQVQFNDNGALGGSAGLVYNKATTTLTATTLVATTGTITTLGSTTGTIATLGSTNGTITTLGATTATIGTLSLTNPLAVASGGTNAATAAAARTNLGLAIYGGSFYYQNPVNVTIPLVSSARYAFTINQLFNLKTTSGTITAAVQINGVNVTGLSGLSVTSTPQSPTATAANTVAIGDRITLVLTSSASAADLEFEMQITR